MNKAGGVQSVAAGARSPNVVLGLNIAQIQDVASIMIKARVLSGVANNLQPNASAYAALNALVGTEQICENLYVPANVGGVAADTGQPGVPQYYDFRWSTLFDGEVNPGLLQIFLTNNFATTVAIAWEYGVGAIGIEA